MEFERLHLAGREFDKHIGELERPNCKIVSMYDDDDYYFEDDQNGIVAHYMVPYYSTDIQDALILVDKYDFYGVNKSFDYELGEYFQGYVERAEEDGTYTRFDGIGDNIAEAFAQAYLAANK